MFDPAQQTAVLSPSGWRTMTQLSLTQAGDLLDWLEAHGIENREVALDNSGMVTVRWLS